MVMSVSNLKEILMADLAIVDERGELSLTADADNIYVRKGLGPKQIVLSREDIENNHHISRTFLERIKGVLATGAL